MQKDTGNIHLSILTISLDYEVKDQGHSRPLSWRRGYLIRPRLLFRICSWKNLWE